MGIYFEINEGSARNGKNGKGTKFKFIFQAHVPHMITDFQIHEFMNS